MKYTIPLLINIIFSFVLFIHSFISIPLSLKQMIVVPSLSSSSIQLTRPLRRFSRYNSKIVNINYNQYKPQPLQSTHRDSISPEDVNNIASTLPSSPSIISQGELISTPSPSPINPLRDVLLLNFVAILFGTQHPIIKLGLEQYDSSAVLNLWRFSFSSLLFISNLKNIFSFVNGKIILNKQTIEAGLELGLWTFLGFAFQSIGLETTTASRSAFLLYLNVKFVPFFAYILFKRQISIRTLISTSSALFGTYLLANDGGSPSIGDLWCVAAAAASAMFILRLEKFSIENKAADLNCVSFLTVALLCFLWTLSDLTFSTITFSQVLIPILSNPLPIIYLGIIATGLCNYLQTIGQRSVPAEKAAIIFSLDPVYGAFFSRLILDERLGVQGYIGAAFIMLGVLMSLMGNLGSRSLQETSYTPTIQISPNNLSVPTNNLSFSREEIYGILIGSGIFLICCICCTAYIIFEQKLGFTYSMPSESGRSYEEEIEVRRSNDRHTHKGHFDFGDDSYGIDTQPVTVGGH